MSSWTLIPCLVELRDEFNQLNPNRDKSTDGSIGDQAHADRSSDHNPDETGATPYEDSDSKNEVHAIDVDCTGPWPSPMTFDLAVNEIRKRCKDGREDRLHNIIWNRQICSESNGWVWQAYTGDNSHTQHAHFSACYESAREADTSPWGLVEKWGDMALSQDDIDKIAKRVWEYSLEDPYDTANPPRQVYSGTWLKYSPSDGDVRAVDEKVQAVQADVDALTGKVDQILAALQPAAAGATKSTKTTSTGR